VADNHNESDSKNQNDDNMEDLFQDEGKGKVVSETIKKLFATGLSAAFMTEESIRGYLGDIKLPKEIVGALLNGASKSKEELMNRVSNEVIKIISKIDFVTEASRFVEDHKFKISAEVEVIKKNSKGKADSDGLIASISLGNPTDSSGT